MIYARSWFRFLYVPTKVRYTGKHVPPLLTTIAHRQRVVEKLLEGTTDKRALADHLDVSRTTIDRSISDLDDAGLVHHDGSDIEVSLYGKIARRQFRKTMDELESLSRTEEVLEHLPSDLDFDLQMVFGADLTVSHPKAPQQPFEQVERMVREGDVVWAYFPILIPRYVDLLHEQTSTSNEEVELFVDDDHASILRAEYPEEFANFTHTERCTLWRVPDLPSYGLINVNDETVRVGAYTGGGGLRGSMMDDSRAAVEWARTVFEEYRDTATEIEAVNN